MFLTSQVFDQAKWISWIYNKSTDASQALMTFTSIVKQANLLAHERRHLDRLSKSKDVFFKENWTSWFIPDLNESIYFSNKSCKIEVLKYMLK